MVDVDADEALVARYDELVPVLMGQGRDGQWQSCAITIWISRACRRLLLE
jgi:hypothetical protein